MPGYSWSLGWWDQEHIREEGVTGANVGVEGEIARRMPLTGFVVRPIKVLCRTSYLTTCSNGEAMIHISLFTNIQVSEGELNNKQIKSYFLLVIPPPQPNFRLRELVFP